MLEHNGKKEINWEIFIHTRQFLLYTVGLGLLSAGLVFLAAIPQFRQAWELRSEHLSEKPKLEKLKQKLASLESVRFTPEFAQVDVVNQALPSKKPLLELMVSLSNVAIETGAVIENFEISPGIVASDAAEVQQNAKKVTSKGFVDTLDVALTVTGSDTAVQQFIREVEQMAPFTTITQLSLTSLLSNSEESQREAVMATSTFFFTKSVKATVEAPLPQLSVQDQQVLANLATLIPSDLPEQTEVTGGGLEDLFGVDPLLFE